jgi:oligopeptide/dipeptide ABC transporter ATP-binding protein
VSQSAGTAGPILSVRGLQKHYRSGSPGVLRRSQTLVQALDGLSFDVAGGESFGLVGESGCGKSTAARCILRLIEPSGGTVTFDGVDVGALGERELRRMRRRMQLVFQDPTGSLDPRMTIGEIVEEPLRVHKLGDAAERSHRAADALGTVGLDWDIARRKPHELSGGQRQRVGIAKALVLEPSLVILDEPVSALDVSIQAQVLNLLTEVQSSLGLTYIFIVHDLAVAEHFCDRLAVLYLGQIMELGSRAQIFAEPLHPYTVALLSAVPIPDPHLARSRSRRVVLQGEVAQQSPDARGCPFRSRCPVGHERQICAEQRPVLEPARSGALIACHFPGELSLG